MAGTYAAHCTAGIAVGQPGLNPLKKSLTALFRNVSYSGIFLRMSSRVLSRAGSNSTISSKGVYR